MKPLLKVIALLSAFFLSTFVLIKLSGVLSVEQVEQWLQQAQQLSPLYVGAIVCILLFADLFIAVPTLTVTILSGFFLGHTYGAVSALCGVVLAGVCGYVLSRYYGESVFRYLVKDEVNRREAIEAFQRHGFVMILLSRALPILPEVTACLSGMTRMPFAKFILAWLISSTPYILIASYAGSISSIENPKPAILAAIGLSGLLWGLWFGFHRYQRNRFHFASDTRLCLIGDHRDLGRRIWPALVPFAIFNGAKHRRQP